VTPRAHIAEKSGRQEFTAKVKDAAWKRSGGRCETGRVAHMPDIGCGRKLSTGDIHYDHIDPDGLTGEATIENCAVLCRSCHKVKTTTHDVPVIARAKRRQRGAVGIKRTRKITRWRKFNGDIVVASRER
jgi:5-methylcytosine-specific restriction endonuclease McrA